LRAETAIAGCPAGPSTAARRLAGGIALLLLLASAGEASGLAERADPLEVPSGPPPAPEAQAALSPADRLEGAAEAFRARGFDQLPILAWAVLETARADRDPELIDRATSLAPGDPGVRFEAGWLARNPLLLSGSFAALVSSFPALAWLISWVGAAAVIAVLSTAVIAAAIGFARAVGLHGHALGHLFFASQPPSWPGVLAICSLLALVPLAGIGLLPLVAVGGALAIARLGLREAIFVGVALALAGLVTGPPLDRWASVASLGSGDFPLLSAWRSERSQPLPGDLERLRSGLNAYPESLLLRLALATALKRQGRIAEAESALEPFPATAPSRLRALAENQRGILALARGDTKRSTEAFEAARSIEESAAVLYNLSQAHGRSLRLGEQTELFAEARARDPELISRFTSFQGANLNQYLIELRIPLSAYIGAAFAPTAAGSELARGLRRGLLGPRAPGWAWALLPALPLAAAILRRRSIRRCSRCLRAICATCDPGARSKGSTCTRCAKLSLYDPRSDARMRKRQVALDRRRQTAVSRVLAALGLLVPGAPSLIEGSAARGALRLLALAAGLAAWLAALTVPAPPELGRLATLLPALAAVSLLGPLYGSSWRESARRLRTSKVMA
jgi:tetratricopeptide (TPR) repeat protein